MSFRPAPESIFIVGGAGFIGSHFTDRLLKNPSTKVVTLFDNFSSGQEWHYREHAKDARLKVIRGDVKDLDLLTSSMKAQKYDLVIHLASNPDIAKAMTDPMIDFIEGTLLTQNVVEAMRRARVPRILYASGSGVYGDLGETEAHENYAPMIPVSTYGASKLAGENLISSYCHMFGLSGCVFRFGNVVGPRQTHGVGYDFIRRLTADPSQLRILGDGKQSKSYIHVEDVVNAVLTAQEKTEKIFEAYNVATGDYITVNEIADVAAECVSAKNVHYEHTGGDRGWKGDVPVIRLSTDRIKKLNWKCVRNSKTAIRDSILSMLKEIQK